MEVTYSWKPAARIPKDLDAAEFGKLVERLEAEFGVVQPQMVVQQARRQAGTPLHRYFVWDDRIAGEQYRLVQARYLLNHLVIRVKVNELPPRDVEVRATYAVVRTEEEGEESPQRGFRLSIHTLTNEEERELLIAQMRSEYRAWRAKWASYHALWGIDDRVAELDAQLSLLK